MRSLSKRNAMLELSDMEAPRPRETIRDRGDCLGLPGVTIL
jgi:hypothetical protein